LVAVPWFSPMALEAFSFQKIDGVEFLSYFDFDLFLDLTENTIGIAGE